MTVCRCGSEDVLEIRVSVRNGAMVRRAHGEARWRCKWCLREWTTSRIEKRGARP